MKKYYNEEGKEKPFLNTECEVTQRLVGGVLGIIIGVSVVYLLKMVIE